MERKKQKRAGVGRARGVQAAAAPPVTAKASLELPSVPPEFWERLDREGVRWAKVGGFDIDGVLRGKYVGLDKLRSALEKGFGFCDVIFGWDMADALYDNSRVTGWHTGYPDTLCVLDPSTLRRIPWEPGVAAMLCDFRDSSGKPHPACPRSLLKRVKGHAESLGYQVRFAAEFEFFFFRETREGLAQKGYTNLQPLDPGMMGYSWLRTGQDAELVRDILDNLAAHDVEIEGFHTETGPGVYEAAIRHDDVLVAADKAALFKTAMKQLAPRHGLSVSFMAKNSMKLPGSSGHLHQSLWRGKSNVFTETKGRDIAPALRSYLGGQMALMREFTALISPTINSYKRYVPGLWAPLSPSWGIDNRTCALRVIDPHSPSGARVECRQGAADINPYIAMAACLGAGLWGIEHELDPGAPSAGDAGVSAERLPTTLKEATALLAQSAAAAQILGAEFVDHYVRTRTWEVAEFERAVTDWETRRYFEMV
ncbi:MAG: glutamine synthetase family protein [Deltaproteobacteria bacterium]